MRPKTLRSRAGATACIAVATVAGLAFQLASAAVALAEERTLSGTVSPSAPPPASPTTFALTVTMTGGDRLGSVVVRIPDGFANVGTATITALPPGKSWTVRDCAAVVDGDTADGNICATANVDQGDTLTPGEAVVFRINATTPSAVGTVSWPVQGFQGFDFNGPRFVPQSAVVTIVSPPAPGPGPSPGAGTAQPSPQSPAAPPPLGVSGEPQPEGAAAPAALPNVGGEPAAGGPSTVASLALALGGAAVIGGAAVAVAWRRSAAASVWMPSDRR